ncbi:DNA circularization protein [Entomobacter blattae]|uniref:DNA circulation N-terminal domain-containing protein n=1 Tax=Entomobacter blattae TaxID=2762277 RepID=A0A7H1NUI8_9PROT|nr:DNA circularization N-terminal domain-containing protein [Entomobacter blattae]QNT79448.1 hypothetical protein JGUZn3_22470 [Entomobacter blattae]
MAFSTLLGQYLQGSFRGVPFAVMGSGGEQGRRIALHTYPNRNEVWPEDLGRKERVYRIRGFVCGDNCYAQRDLLTIAAEQEGYGLLVHPTLGSLYVSVLRYSWEERDGQMGVIDISFEFVEYKNQLVTTILDDADDLLGVSDLLNETSTDFFTTNLSDVITYSAPVLSVVGLMATQWGQGAIKSFDSPVAIFSLSYGLNGNYGRFVSTGAQNTGTIQDSLAAFSANREALQNTISSLSSASITNLPKTVQTIPEHIRTALSNPAVQISQILPLTQIAPADANTTLLNTQTAQKLTVALCRQAALASLIRSTVNWQPTSWDEVQAFRAQFNTLFDQEIFEAADQGAGDLYQTLKASRKSVLEQLASKSVTLAHLQNVSRQVPVSALLLAQELYGNGARAAELIRRANPIHPAFMPTSFEALAN